MTDHVNQSAVTESLKSYCHSCDFCSQWIFNFNHTPKRRRQTCLGRIREILLDPQLEFSDAAQQSIAGMSLFDVTRDQLTNAVSKCHMAFQMTGRGYVEDIVREIDLTWRNAGQFSTFAARMMMGFDRCYFGVLQLEKCPKNGFKVVKFHEIGASSLEWEILTFEGECFTAFSIDFLDASDESLNIFIAYWRTNSFS